MYAKEFKSIIVGDILRLHTVKGRLFVCSNVIYCDCRAEYKRVKEVFSVGQNVCCVFENGSSITRSENQQVIVFDEIDEIADNVL